MSDATRNRYARPVESTPAASIRFDQPAIADLELPEGVDLGPDAAESLRLGVATATEMGATSVRWWTSPASEAADDTARVAGLDPSRDLLHLRISLPAPAPDPSLVTRPFTPADTDRWIALNNRAFAWHPEQSDMTPVRLAAITAESWFDPAGFLLHEREGRLAGFCWTKVHRDHDPLLGEIFVIAVDPDFAGAGLGRELTLAGLDHLHRAGAVIGGLYVESDNTTALAAYRRIGFTLHHIQRAYTVATGP